MPNPTPERQDSRLFPTPKTLDVLFYELNEVSRECPPGVQPPEYGTAHPRTADFPGFKLCLIEGADDEGLWQKWWYVADRALQESYNYEITYPYGGATRYPRITQTMILPRDDNRIDYGTEWAGTLFDGNVEYLQPSGSVFGYLQPSPSTDTYVFPTGSGETPTLVAQTERQLPYDSKIGSLYVEVTRIYDIIPGIDDTSAGAGTFQTDNGYTVTRPRGEAGYLRLVWNLVLPREIADANRWPDLVACPISPYGNLLMVDETIVSSDAENQTSKVTRVFEGNYNANDAFPSTNKVQYQGMFYPGSMPPEKYIVSYRRVVDTTEIATPEQNTVTSPSTSPYAVPPNTPRSALMSVEIKPENVIRGQKVVETYTDLVLTTLSGEAWDDNLKDYVPYTTYAILTSAVSGLGVPAAGTERQITPYNDTWSVVTIETPNETANEGTWFETIGYGLDTLATSLATSSRSYMTMIPAHWPQVLQAFRWGFTPDGTGIYSDYKMKEEWTGLCRAVVSIGWAKSSPGWWQLDSVPSMRPTELNIRWPSVGSISIPACLHYNYDWVVSDPGPTGSFYFYATSISSAYEKIWEPTNPPDWPDYIIKEINVVPYKGGFRLEKVVVYKPEEY